jgi:hypothetical protein
MNYPDSPTQPNPIIGGGGPKHRARHTGRKILTAVAGLALFGIGIGIGAGTASSSATKTVVVNHTLAPQVITVPGPTKTVIKTKTVQAPAPSQGSVIDTFHGTGNDVTPEFNVPSDGNYIVSWTFSNNTFGNGDMSGTNFILSTTGANDISNLANDIAVSGHGSGEVQMAGSTDSIGVQAGDNASWTLTIKSA